jgi:serine/threonine-protein kinase
VDADNSAALQTQVYQAILERRPAPIISRLKDILATSDPRLGYLNGSLRLWLGWAQDVTGDHAAAQETWRQARSELEPFVKNQPEDFGLIGDLALVNISLRDKAAAFALAERYIALVPVDKDALVGPGSIEVLARAEAQTGDPERAIDALEKLLSIPYAGPLPGNVPLTRALLRIDPMFDPLRVNPRFEKLIGSGTNKPATK